MRDQAGAYSTYEIEESSTTHVFLVAGELVHHVVPLFVARLIRHEGLIEEIHDHLREVSLKRIETLEQETLIGVSFALSHHGYPECKMIERYMWGLTDNIQRNVASSKLKNIREAIRMAHDLMDKRVRAKAARNGENKWKWKGNYQNNSRQQDIQQEVVRAYTAGPDNKKRYTERFLLFNNYKKTVYIATDCRTPTSAIKCMSQVEESNHGNQGSNGGNRSNGGAHERSFIFSGGEATQDPNVITGKSRMNIISCIKTKKYLQKGCHVFLEHIKEKKYEDKSEEKRLEDVTIVQDFPEDRVSEIKDAFGNKKYKPEDMQELFCKLFNDVQNIHEELAEYINTPSWNRPTFSNYDDDDDNEDYTIAITPEEPDNSLSIGDEHFDSFSATKSDEVIKFSVEDLVLIPSESEGILDNTYDVPFHDNSSPLDVSKDQFEEFFDFNDDSTSIDDDYFSIDNIDYVEASPPDSELVSFDGEIEEANLHEKLLNINILIAKIKSLNDNPTPDSVLKSPSPFPILVEDSDAFLEKSDTSLSYSDNSLPESKLLAIIRKRRVVGKLTSVVIKDNLAEPQVHVPNVLPTYLTLMLDLDFIPSDNSLLESKILYFDVEEKNSGSTTIHADISLSDLKCFNFKSEPDPSELTSIVDTGIHENVIPATNVNLSPEDDQSPLFAYVVWIFLSFLRYPVVPPYLLSYRNEDTIFDPDISNYHFSSLEPGVSHRSGTFMKFIVYQNHLNESSMEILSSTCSPMDQ
uniref:Reverse transcriptase domain-containing protein n=1 Tax=Tanacetum cinerariifolium TaxID=118510 RepID=A0A6L2LGC2_TANCI|nr:hypothetical protein [Tanacetum cinerariifolium]